MTSEFTRRGFLKGLSAIAGVIAIPLELKTKDDAPLIWTPDQPIPIIPHTNQPLTVTVSQGDKVLLKYAVNPYGHHAWMSSPNDPIAYSVVGRNGKEVAYLQEISLHTTSHRIDGMKHRTFVSSTGHVIENLINA